MYNFFKNMAWLLSKLIYRIEYEGLENIPSEGAFILVGNHTHNFDPVVISFATKRKIHYLAKVELFKTKLTKWLFESVECISIDRSKNDIMAIKNALKVLKNGEILGIFPEGTRIKNENDDVQIKSGAALIASKAKVNILPVAISANYKFFSKVKIKILPMYDIEAAKENYEGSIEKISEDIMDKIYNNVENKR